MSSVHVGCCGFPLAHAVCYERFELIEVQQTFYQPPRIATLRRWREEAPAAFAFTLKAWQLITHEPSSPTYRRLKLPVAQEARERLGAFRPTPEVFAAWETTLECARALAARVLVFQSPASFAPTDRHLDNLREFFARARPAAVGLILGWEPRGWPVEAAQAICRELGLLRVVDPFRDHPPEGRLRYFRLHGRDSYNYRYSDAELEALVDWCRGETYCLFNNTNMAEDATRLADMLRARGR